MILRDEDLTTWRDVVRAFLEAEVDVTDRPAGPRVDRDLWRRACTELGLADLDAGFGALAVTQRECGRVLAPLPVLGSVVTAQALLAGADGQDLMTDLQSGERVAAAVLDVPDLDVVGEGRVTGRVADVMDGQSADLLVLATAEGQVLVVETDADGVRRTPQNSMDLTRDFASFDLDAAPVRRLDADAGLLDDVRRRRAVAVACEQHGGAERALEMGVAHTLERVQFGRKIGSFQALKHRCADLAVELDLSESAVEHAVWAVHTEAPDAALAVALAGSVCGETFLRCALENVQLHGGIGFTWEHPAHLYVRRAETDLALFGDASVHREAVLVALGI